MEEEKIKIVYFGTPEFAMRPLEALIGNDNFEVLAVVTQEDKKVGRKQVLTPPPIKVLAQEYEIPVLQPPKVKGNREIEALLMDLQPDFIVVTAYGQILPPEILEIPKEYCVNIHGSLLPKYRGASPIEESIRKGEKETGITFMKMEEKMDAGPILHVQRAPIDPSDTGATLREKLSILAGTLLPAVLQDILDGTTTPIPQDEHKATYCHKISKQDGLIDLETMTAEEIHNTTRAYNPWPSCFLSLGEKRLKLIETETELSSKESKNVKPGEIIEKEEGKIGIGTKKGLIIPLKIQLEGKNPMSIQEFLRGNSELLTSLLTKAK